MIYVQQMQFSMSTPTRALKGNMQQYHAPSESILQLQAEFAAETAAMWDPCVRGSCVSSLSQFWWYFLFQVNHAGSIDAWATVIIDLKGSCLGWDV